MEFKGKRKKEEAHMIYVDIGTEWNLKPGLHADEAHAEKLI